MKIVVFKSGLGNQIFVYFFCEYLRNKNYHVYSYSTKKWTNIHNGVEINKIFDINYPKATLFSNLIALFCRISNIIFRKIKSTDVMYDENSVYFDGYWQDKKYFNYIDVRELKFRDFSLSQANREVMKKIAKGNCISIHFRRGDYLDPIRINEYGKSCTVDYYNKAIDIILSKYTHPYFLVFSDDIDWVKKNISLPSELTFVDWNKGKDSFIDMYLMSQCNSCIIANSSFSYWGAMLGVPKKIVIRPAKWIGNDIPDIFPEEWIAIKP